MTPYTQTPNSCWQTVVACILDIEPALLPCQVSLEGLAEATTEYKGVSLNGRTLSAKSYNNMLNAYLAKHHGMVYFEMYPWQFGGLKVTAFDGYHGLIGPTVRTQENGSHHVVVAKDGVAVWDPHPSRSGLTKVERWGIVAPTEDEHMGWRKEMMCLCPACLDEAKAKQ